MALWKVRTKNRTEFSELNSKWDDIKKDVIEMVFTGNDGKTIYLPKNMESYVQFKTASAEIGKNNVQIESRVIGFKLGNNIVKVRVDEKTNNIRIEID